MAASRLGADYVSQNPSGYYLVVPVKKNETIGANRLVGVRSTDGFLEEYDPASVAAAYTYNIVGVAIEPIDTTADAADGDTVTDKQVKYDVILKMDTNADATDLDLGVLVYGETDIQVKVAAQVDGIQVGRLVEYLGANVGRVFIGV